MKIAIIAAMDKEYELLKGKIWQTPDKITVSKSGIGKVNAALNAAELIRKDGVDMIISTGVGGGTGNGIRLDKREDTGISVCDVVIADRVAYHDVYCGSEVEYGKVMGMPLYYQCDKEVIEAERKSIETWGNMPFGVVRTGLIVSGDWFVDTKEKAEDILRKFPEAVVVDMESAAIAQTCYKYNKKFASIRMVSDTPLSGNNREQYDNFWDKAPDFLAQATTMIIEATGREREANN